MSSKAVQSAGQPRQAQAGRGRPGQESQRRPREAQARRSSPEAGQGRGPAPRLLPAPSSPTQVWGRGRGSEGAGVRSGQPQVRLGAQARLIHQGRRGSPGGRGIHLRQGGNNVQSRVTQPRGHEGRPGQPFILLPRSR